MTAGPETNDDAAADPWVPAPGSDLHRSQWLVRDDDGVWWLLTPDDLYWTRVEAGERLMPVRHRCKTCGAPLHPNVAHAREHRRCRFCLTGDKRERPRFPE